MYRPRPAFIHICLMWRIVFFFNFATFYYAPAHIAGACDDARLTSVYIGPISRE